MMIKKMLFLTLCLIISNLFLNAASEKIAVAGGDFEFLATDLYNYWQVVSKNNQAEVSLSSEAKSGKGSLLIKSEKWDSVAVISRKLSLKPGRLYRLTAFLKTKNLFSNPQDRYPTSVPACVSLAGYPFTNHSPAAGASRDWQQIELLFVAVSSSEQIRLNFGYNGSASGSVWFDQIELEEAEDITGFIPAETISRYNKGYRFATQGWIYLHIEGNPVERGLQHGYLLAEEILAYIRKLALRANEQNPVAGWQNMRLQADALFLRGFEPEFLEEMRAIAEGVNRSGKRADFLNRTLDLLDIVTVNSAIDLGQLDSALRKTPHALSFKPFSAESGFQERLHKCSAFLANNSATVSGDLLFAQMFMWNGYTGVHWNIIVDLMPERGFRLVFQTFPGGIHSGADFYLNSGGLIIGETTVQQTPFESSGTPQSNRIRKAVQYASSIDEFVKIMREGNNGLYTNDWLVADYKRNELAVFLLGTKKSKLWRSSQNDFPAGTKDFYWSVNNNKDDLVRREYVADADNAGYHLQPGKPRHRLSGLFPPLSFKTRPGNRS